MPVFKAPSAEPAARVARLFERVSSPLVMGIVNVTPDSFYPASRASSRNEAVARAEAMIEQGADIIDVGGQSARPGSEPVPETEELDRVAPVVEALASRTDALVSVDTDKARVAGPCRALGASILNDVTALRGDPGMIAEAVRFPALVLMHMGGDSPKTMQCDPSYGDVVKEVKEFLQERINAFVRAGGDADRVLIDPGIGFGKNLEHNLSLLKHLEELDRLAPVVLGASRKSFLGRIMAATETGGPHDPEERLSGTLAVACWAALQGVRILRVHDVLETRRALGALSAVREAV